MFGSTILEVAIGLAFVYLLLSLICSAINEALAGLFAWRSKTLEQGISTMLGHEGLVKDLYAHPLIDSQYRAKRKPSYISAHTFALTLIDVLHTRAQESSTAVTGVSEAHLVPDAAARLAPAIRALPAESALRRTLLVLMEESGTDIHGIKRSIEHWYNDTMQRVSGWYKRKVQISLILISLGVSLSIGVDTVSLATAFWRDPTLRASVVAAAQQTTKNSQATTNDRSVTQIPTLQRELAQLTLPAGWGTRPSNTEQWASKILGILLTTIALSLGAPFWFGFLNKLVNLRASGPKPAGVPADGSSQ